MDVRKGFLALLLVPLVLLSGCNNTNTSKQPMSSFKCSLPSRPGVIQANVTDFPTELIVSSSQNTPVTFTVMFTNTMTDANYGKSEVKVEYSFIPNVGEIYTGSIDLPLAQYIQAEDKLIPMSDQDVINTEIPKEISGIGVYSGTLKWEFDAKTQADIPICIGYDPTITHVAPENLVCDPRDLPKPCYSASPVIAKVEKVTCVGSPKAGASHKGKCIITLKVVDEYGGLGECFQSNYNYLPNVTVDKIELIVDGASFQDNDGTGVLKCSGYSKNRRGKKILYVSQTSTITCFVDLDKLKNQCDKSGKCSLPDDSLIVGKSAVVSMKLSYHYCKLEKLGPAKLVKID